MKPHHPCHSVLTVVLLTLALSACLADKDTADSKQTLATATASTSAAQPSTPTQSSATAQTHQQSNQYGQSPYSLEQIEEHLRQIYAADLQAQEGLMRWEVPVMRYAVGSYSKALVENDKAIFRDKFQKYGDMVGIKTVEIGGNNWRNVLIIFTENFLRSIKEKEMRRILFNSPSDDRFTQIEQQFKDSGQTSYGIIFAHQSDQINKLYGLHEIEPQDRPYLDVWADFIVFNSFIPRKRGYLSNKIMPSIFNYIQSDPNILRKERKVEGILQPIDRYFLEALYSDQIYYGMPVSDAISIMSQFIYQKLKAPS